MKILRNSALLLLGLSFSVPAALACPPSVEWFHHLTNPTPQGDIDHPDRQCDQNGHDSGRGHNCDRGLGNGGGYCGVDTNGGSTSSGGGDTVNPPSPKS